MASYKLIVKNAKVILKTVTNAVLNITGIKDLLTGSGSVDSNTKIDWTLQHYTNTATNFTSTNPILLVGQLGIETDDLLTAPKYKIGDGVTAWNTLPYNSSGGSGLSGLTTNKVLKATSSTTAGNSNITDDGTTVTVASPNGVNKVEVSDSLVKMYYESVINGLRGYVESDDVKSKIFHDLLIQLNAPSVTKNGIEVATVDDIPSVLSRKYFAYNNTTYSYTGTTAGTILRTIYVPSGTMNIDSTLELHAIFGKSGTAGTMNYGAYITTNPTVITGGSSVKINSFASYNLQGGFVLRLTNKNALNSQAIQLQNPAANQYDTWQTANFARTLLSIDFAVDQYIHIYSTLANAADTAIIYDYQCYIDKN